MAAKEKKFDTGPALAALGIMQAGTRSQIEATQMAMLLNIYEEQTNNPSFAGYSLSELGAAVGLTGAAAGRNNARFQKDYGLTQTYIDIDRPRATVTRLTPKGIKLVEGFLTALRA